MTNKAKQLSVISFVRICLLKITLLMGALSGNAYANGWDATGLSASVTSSAPYTASVSWTNTTNPSYSEVKVYRNGTLISTTAGTSLTDGSLQAGTTYTYKVITCLIAFGCEADGPSVSVTTGGGVSPPESPSSPVVIDTSLYLVNSLSASASSPTLVNVTWSPPVAISGLNGYRIYRNGVYLSEVSAISYTDGYLQASTKYFYTVVSCYLSGGCQSTGSTVYIDTPSVLSAKNVTNLSAISTSANSVTLGWAPPSDESVQTEYRIYRNTSLVGTVKSTNYTDSGLSPLTSYTYQVLRCTVNSSCISDGPRTTATTLRTPPKPATSLSAQAFGININLAWIPSVDGANVSDYKVYRDGVMVGSTKNSAYTDTNLSPSTTYKYLVFACYADSICDASGTQVTVSTDKPAITIPASLLSPTSQSASSSQQNIEMVAKTSGEMSNLTLTIKVKIPLSKPASVFVAFLFNGSVWFLDSKGAWTLFKDSSSAVEFQFINDTPAEIDIPIVKNLDVSSIKGGLVVVGFASKGLTVKERLDSLLNNASYNVIYTVGP